MKISQNGIDLIKGFEGFSAKPYLCPAGVWTIGYGRTRGISRNTPHIDQEQAEKYLRDDIAEAERAVNRYVKGILTQNRYDALVSLVFNIGAKAFKYSTMLRLINENAHAKVPEQFMRWVYSQGNESKGLARRRLHESALYQTKDN